MELRFSPLFSGSSGNAIYVGCDDAHILVDAGMSGTRVIQEMMSMGIDPRRLNGQGGHDLFESRREGSGGRQR